MVILRIRSMKGPSAPKGASLYQIINNPLRLTKPKYRAAGAAEWKEVEWDWALDEIAKKIKDTRDRTFKFTSKSKVKEKQPDGTETRGRKGIHGQQDRCHSPCGQRGPRQRRMLYAPETAPFLGACLYRTPGPNMTLRNCCGSGRVVRSRCNDEPLDRSQEC